MNGTAILIAAVCGGVGGLVGALLAKSAFKSSPSVASILPAILGVVCAAVGVQLAHNTAITDKINPPSRTDVALRPYAKQLDEDPVIKARLMSDPAHVQDTSRELAHQGLKRLSAADLDRWNDLRIALSDKSKPMCVAFWTGSFASIDITKALELLPDPSLSAWYELSFKAMSLEAHAAPIPPNGADKDALMNGITAVEKKLGEADRTRLHKDILSGGSLVGDESCWALQKMLTAAKQLDPQAREAMIRAMASI